ncbi:transcription termination factor MTERF4, chloroplastic-like [Salvia hispanica]|uniref:transcription termination factor MTERF4, chloroplastic-like n=1 Tax=Salvia hispanica TaxID=49212 RepID=UPI002009151F|nr:transcription termination factor MTERF4, chloroplastic-like [Salvia hispanica]
MIAIARKNLSCLFINPNSFLCNSNVLSFSTWRLKTLIPVPEICDVLVNKHQFPPELASLASSRLPKFRDPQRADSVLSFLKENSFTTAQLQKLVVYNPRILGFTIEGLKSRLKVFQDLGLSSEEIAKMISSSKAILHSSMANKIIPNLSMLKGLSGSNDNVARLVKRCPWVFLTDLEKTLMPNVEILKRCSIPMERILHLLYIRPRTFLVKSDIMRRSVDKAIEIGVPLTSIAFIHAVGIFNHTSEGMWEVKLQTLRDLGFSDDDVLAMFRKQPPIFNISKNKMTNKVELLLATRKYGVTSIVANPVALGGSIEKRLEPRVQILRLLESRNLIEKWPSLSFLATSTDGRFIDRFIRPYYDVIGKEHIAKVFIEGRKR